MQFPEKFGLGYAQCVLKGQEDFKSPLLVVGCNVFLHDKFSSDYLRVWDIYMVFYPHAENAYCIGIIGISRNASHAFSVWNSETSVDAAILGAIAQAVNPVMSRGIDELSAKAVQWLRLSIYRCPKIALKDVLSLESYSEKNAA